jgi:endosialidase-like protein
MSSGRDATERLQQLRGVTWEWRDDAPAEAKENIGIGVIAQDVAKIFPELVARTSEGHLTVDYYGLIGPIIEGIKELDDRLRALEEASAQPTDHSG